jgi:Cu2+-exporting ATPase
LNVMQTVSPSPSSPSYQAPTPEQTVLLDVSGMKCAGCVKAVEDALMQVVGVDSAVVNLATESALVTCQTNVIPDHLAAAVSELGFPTQARSAQGTTSHTEAYQQRLERRQQAMRDHIQRTAIATFLLLFSTIGHLDHLGWMHIPLLSHISVHWGLATLALLFPGRDILVDGWNGFRRLAPNMNSLVGLGTLTAYFTSCIAFVFPQLGWECFFDEPVMLVGFILLGRTLEQRARIQAATALESLMALRPTLARLIQTPQPEPLELPTDQVLTWATTTTPAEQVSLGAWLQVLPGDKVPVDGEIVAGQTTVDESLVTGESMPVTKQPGDRVMAGSLNQTGAIAIRATQIGQDTTLAQIIQWVETAQTRKAPIQRLADQVAGVFTYGIMAIATVTFLFWYGVGVHLWPDLLATAPSDMSMMASHAGMPHHSPTTASALLLSLKLAIAVLVVACPCALGLATPTAILVGSGIGAEHGLLIRGGDVLESVSRLTTVVFDKTGTLTAGSPTVTAYESVHPDFSPDQVIQLAASTEAGTRHPFARAIQAKAQERSLPLLHGEQFYTEAGSGVRAVILGQDVRVGTVDWLSQRHPSMADDISALATTTSSNQTPIYVSVNGVVAGWLSIQDQLRPEAKATVEQLQAMGLEVRVLTGDRPQVAEAIATDLNLSTDFVMANVKPTEKATVIQQLQEQGHHIAMVGDGMNDAPALAQANIGISLHSGTEIATEIADIILMRDRLTDLVNVIQLSQATLRKIRQNLFWAFTYNLVAIPLAAGALLPITGLSLSPAIAGALMATSSLTVVTNSLLLKRIRFRDRDLEDLDKKPPFSKQPNSKVQSSMK